MESFHKRKIIPGYLTQPFFCENFRLHPILEPSVRSLENVPDFYQKNPILFVALTYHHLFALNCYDFIRILKLIVRIFSLSVLLVKNLLLKVIFFMKMAKPDQGITLYQTTTFRANWNIVEINEQMFYLNYGKIKF